MKSVIGTLIAGGCVLSGACSTPQGTEPWARSSAAECALAGPVGTVQAQDIASLRINVEGGPLFLMPYKYEGLQSCQASVESKAIVLQYRFKSGGRLRVERDSSIEYTDQAAHFLLPQSENAATTLAAAERHTYGAGGCGIDYRSSAAESSSDEPGTTDTVFRGDVCNCQGRIRRDASGRIVGLVLRSAC